MAQTTTIGPWPGGLNLTSNRDMSPYLNNDELGAAINIQYTREGFIESRPGFRVFPNDTINTTDTVVRILGTILISDQQVAVVQVKKASVVEIYYVRGDKQVFWKANFTSDTMDFTSVLALNNSDAALTDQVPRGVLLFDSSAVDNCWRLEEYPTFDTNVTPTKMNAALKIPASHFSFSVKDRVFLVNKKTSILSWSALNTNSLWFDYNEVSGGNKTQRAIEAGWQGMDPSLDRTDDITACEFINNSFYLFKKASTYMYTYQAKPEEDGYLRKISSELGAFDSTLFRNTVVVINERGIFSVEGTEFVDLQIKLNLRFEYYLDVINPQAFITDFNGHILIGYKSKGVPYYYVLNGYTRGWSQWTFDYVSNTTIASPGSQGVFCRTTSDEGIILFTTFDKTTFVHSNWKPELLGTPPPYEYSLDSTLVTDSVAGQRIRYIPKLTLYTKAQLGDSLLNYKKVYRSYVRIYLSDYPTSTWVFTINYNDYKFTPGKNPTFTLVTRENAEDLQPMPNIPEPRIPTQVTTAVYKRTYQLPFAQQRAIEFVYEITRPYTQLVEKYLTNPSPDSPNQQGYYFMLSGIWVDYEDKARI